MSSISERATARRPQQREKRLPRFIALAKIGNGWQRLGAAWDLRSGEEGLSVQLNTVPVGNWDGRFSLFLPNQDPPADDTGDE